MTPAETVLQTYSLPFTLHPLQVKTVDDLAPMRNSGLWLDMGCVDSQTEYLSPDGWRPISEYESGQVAQYEPADGSIQFVEPTEFIKKPCPEMIRIKTHYGVDQLLSPEHRVLLSYYGCSNRNEVLRADQLEARHDNWLGGAKHPRSPGTVPWSKACIPSTFTAPGGCGLTLTDIEIRIQIASIADGHFSKSGTSSRVTIRLKKWRKIERLRTLLLESKLMFREHQEDTPTAKGFIAFTFYAPLRDKEFGGAWWSATNAQLKVIADEVMHWDGSVSEDKPTERFSTRSKASADFVQFVFCGTGRTARVCRFARDDGIDYEVVVRKAGAPLQLTSLASDGSRKSVVSRERSTDGFKYCFSVPSTFLVFRRNGCVFASGNTGKTVVSTIIALYLHILDGTRCVVIMPPTLVTQWAKWLARLNPAPTVTAYRGTPAQRKKLNMSAQFILVGIQIFKRDYEVFQAEFGFVPRTVIIDEATIVANIDSGNHETVYDFAMGSPVMALSGTPMNKPGDAYGLLKFTAPGTYRSKKQFENLHVEERDFYGEPTKWQNLDRLNEAMQTNSARILFRDMYPEAGKPLYVPIEYDLDPEHEKLYRRLVNDEMLKLPDGGKIDGTTAARLRHALGQIVVNWGHFAGNPDKRSDAVKLIEEKLAELGDGKLVVFANYKMTVAHLTAALSKYGAVSYNSEVSATQKDRNFDRFCEDPTCRVIVVQFISGGKGLDGMQHVCNVCLFIEPCLQPRDFHQAVARLDRLGQKKGVIVYLAIAERTLQIKGFQTLIQNDILVNKVIRNAIELRQELLGV